MTRDAEFDRIWLDKYLYWTSHGMTHRLAIKEADAVVAYVRRKRGQTFHGQYKL